MMTNSLQIHRHDNHSHMPQLNIYCIDCKQEISYSHLTNVLQSTGYLLTLAVQNNMQSGYNVVHKVPIELMMQLPCTNKNHRGMDN